MRKLYITLFVILLLMPPTHLVYASNSYARITAPLAHLYHRASIEIEDNVICNLEQTYFVEITLDYDADFYKVLYNGIAGYVLKKDVTKVVGTPYTPFPKSNITTINNKCYLRSSPKISENNIVTVIPDNCTNLTYIGKIYGEEAIDYQGNLWYLVSYYGVQGYIYSKYIAEISTIAMNSEIIDEIANNEIGYTNPLNNTECAIIIAGLSLPIILLIIIMYIQPKDHVVKNKGQKVKKPKEISHDDLL